MTNLKKLFEQATARPWKTVRVNDTRIMVHNLSNDGDNYSNHVCDAHKPANAQLITLAANHFEAVVKVTEDCLAFWDQPPSGPGGNTLRKVWLDKIKDNARAVLAAIEKEAS